MPRYFFVIRWPDRRHNDDVGFTNWPSDVAAREYAERVIRELKASDGYEDPGLTMFVQNGEREALFTIPFHAEVAASNNAKGDSPPYFPLGS